MTPRSTGLRDLRSRAGWSVGLVLGLMVGPLEPAPAVSQDLPPGPAPEERQLPEAMRADMTARPSITVGQSPGEAVLVGSDNRALQAAVDYIAGLGGGVVEIGPGVYLMNDALHLRSNVTVRGVPGETILKKAPAAVSRLEIDGDYGEEQITVENPEGFEVGAGVAVWDDRSGGFHTTVARITGARGRAFAIDTPLRSDCLVSSNATAATVFPVVSAQHATDVVIDGLTIDGDKQNNPHLNGCRGAGIYLLRAHRATIRNCQARDYNGDGISFQQSNDVQVIDCLSEGNTQLGLHPGSGSQRPVVTRCVARRNGTDGLFLCWRVRHGRFEQNLLENNGRFGISIGHKDSDNLIAENEVVGNRSNGVFFRNESAGMSPHRNRLENNLIAENGDEPGTAAIRIRGAPDGLLFLKNTIRDTRGEDQRTQTIGVLVEEAAGRVELNENTIEAEEPVVDRRPASSANAESASESEADGSTP